MARKQPTERTTNAMKDAIVKGQEAGFSKEELDAVLEAPQIQQLTELLADIIVNPARRGRYYAVDVVCPKCGEKHRLSEGVWLHDGPESTSSLGDYCVSQERVPSIVSLLKEKVWCETEGEWVQQTHCNQVFLTAT